MHRFFIPSILTPYHTTIPCSDSNIQSWEIGPPPDLPSLLLNNRIIYVGMPLVPSVTELVIAQLLYLNYQNDKMITMYINSPGTNAPGGGVSKKEY